MCNFESSGLEYRSKGRKREREREGGAEFLQSRGLIRVLRSIPPFGATSVLAPLHPPLPLASVFAAKGAVIQTSGITGHPSTNGGYWRSPEDERRMRTRGVGWGE